MGEYGSSVVGLSVLCLIPVILAGLSGPRKGRSGLIAGPVTDARDENPIYRLDRAHMNSVETLASFAVPAILAMSVGVSAGLLAALVWAQVVMRVVYTGIYLRGGTAAKGGNLRTALFILASAITVILTGATVWTALG